MVNLKVNGTTAKDVFAASAAGEDFNGLYNFDSVSYAAATSNVWVDLANGAHNTNDAAGDTYTSIEAFSLTKFADLFDGSTGNDIVNGGAGSDVLNGKNGNDALTGDVGNDTLNAGNGNDAAWGGGGNDKMWGDSGNDTIIGGADTGSFVGVDSTVTTLVKTGRFTAHYVTVVTHSVDQIVAGDTLTGGAGADTFTYNIGDGVDQINDFIKGVDHINLAASWFDGNKANGEVLSFARGVDTMITFSETSVDGMVDNNGILLKNFAASAFDMSLFV